MNIRKIAELAGTSHMTVSRVLNGSDKVADKTREKILSIVQEQGYEMNAGARSLALGLHQIVGLLYPYHNSRTYESWYTMQLLHRIRTELRECNFDTMIAGYDISQGFSDITRLIAQKKVDGIIISGYEITEEIAQKISSITPKYILVNPPAEPWTKKFNCLLVNHESGGEQAAQLFLEKNITNICLISENTKQFFARLTGFIKGFHTGALSPSAEKSALSPSALSLEKDHFMLRDGSYECAYQYAKNNQERLLQYRGAFVGSDLSAIGIINGLADQGVRIPEDFAVVGFDDIDWAEYVRPALTTIHQPKETVAIETANLIVELINQPEQQVIQKTFSPYPRIRSSL